MKTLQELYKEVIASEELKKEFMEASKDEKNAQKNVEEFLKKHGCDATYDDLQAFFKEKNAGELSEDEVEAVAGGKDGGKLALSILTINLGCGLYDAIEYEKSRKKYS